MRGTRVILFHLLAHDEVTFPFERMTRFEGLEEMGRLTADPLALKEAYLAEVSRFRNRLRRVCLQNRIDLVETDTSTSIGVVLAAYLAIPFALWPAFIGSHETFFHTVPVSLFLFIPVFLTFGRDREGLLDSMGRTMLGVLFFVFCIAHLGLLVHETQEGLPQLFGILVLAAELPQRLLWRSHAERALSTRLAPPALLHNYANQYTNGLPQSRAASRMYARQETINLW